MLEIWRDAPGYENRLEVSNLGQVRSKDREYTRLDRRGGHIAQVVVRQRGRMLRGGIDGHGYRTVSPVKGTTIKVCILVALAFIGPRPSPRHLVRHKNDDRGNDSLDNLLWGTKADNYNDALRNGRAILGDRSPRSKLKPTDIPKIRKLVSCGKSDAEIARTYKVTPTTIWQIRKGINWKHF